MLGLNVVIECGNVLKKKQRYIKREWESEWERIENRQGKWGLQSVENIKGDEIMKCFVFFCSTFNPFLTKK